MGPCPRHVTRAATLCSALAIDRTEELYVPQQRRRAVFGDGAAKEAIEENGLLEFCVAHAATKPKAIGTPPAAGRSLRHCCSGNGGLRYRRGDDLCIMRVCGKRGRAVEGTSLENWRRCEPFVSSNLTASAKIIT